MSEAKEEQEIKKEIQEKIIPLQETNEKVTEEELSNVLKLVAPGTNLRTALDGTLKAGKGALIVVDNGNLTPLLDGGFRVSCRFTPQKLVELTKMDGAIILSKDLKKIVHANVMLTPNSSIKSSETGTRHKSAERTARQTGGLVIAISERKHEINLFYKNIKYHLKNTDEILRKASEQIQLLEKHKELFDKFVEKLNKSELRNYHNILQAVYVVQKGRIIQKISKDLKKYIVELGNEGTLLKTRLKEITMGVDRETDLAIKDYTKLDLKKSRILLNSLSYDEILDTENILRVLAHDSLNNNVTVKGWRLLSKTSLIEQEIATIIKELGTLGKVINSNASTYSKLIGDEKANSFKEEIERMKLSF